MDLRHDDELPPLTDAQQAETLRLAARLQAEHEARSSSEALLRAAAEAGIEARFVREAALRVIGERPARRESSRSVVAVAVMAFLTALALLGQPAESVGIVLPFWLVVLMAAITFALAVWVGRERRVRWTVPAAVPVLWLGLSLPDVIYHTAFEGRGLPWLPTLILIVGGLQLAAALAGAAVGWYEPRARTGRLFRPE